MAFLRNTVIGATLMMAAALPGLAQETSGSRVAANTDWSVFVEGDPPDCWGVSAPKETVNTKDGKPAQVKRGEILLFITYRKGTKGEVSFTGGYPFATDKPVAIDIGGTAFNLIIDGEWAWAASPEDDQKIIEAMKSGTSAVVTAQSAKGTKTQDTFSLQGFSAAVDEAAKRCGG